MPCLFDGFCYVVIAEKRALVNDVSGIYIRPVNEHVIALRRQRRLQSHLTWHGDILIAKFDTLTKKYIDIDGSDIPLVYNILVRPKYDTPWDVEKLTKAATENALKSHVKEDAGGITTTVQNQDSHQ